MPVVAAVFPPERARPFFRDHLGLQTRVKDEDSIESYTIDWQHALGAGVTISTSVWRGDGVTIDSDSNTTTTATAVVSQTGGEARNTITTSDGQTFVERLQFIETNRRRARRDYPFC